MASITRVPFFGTSKSASKSVSLVEINRDGAALIQTHKTCEFRVLEDSKFIKMIFPDKFVAALARHSYPLQLDKDAQGWRYRADLGIERSVISRMATKRRCPPRSMTRQFMTGTATAIPPPHSRFPSHYYPTESFMSSNAAIPSSTAGSSNREKSKAP